MPSRGLIAALGVAIAWSAPLAAQETRVTLTPYLWVPTIKGTATLGPLSLPIRATPEQLASGLRAGLLGHAMVERGNLFLAAEVIAVDFRRRRFAPVLGQDLAARAVSIEAEAGYAFPVTPDLSVGPFAGVRFNDLKVDVGTAPANLPLRGRWIEPALGLNARARITSRWTANMKLVRGLGRDDRHAFDARADLDYRFARRFSAFAGYRRTRQVYAGDGFAIDLKGAGPLLGVRGRF